MIEFAPWPEGEALPPDLLEGDAHLWCARLDDDGSLERLGGALSPDERARASRIALPGQRRRFVAARGRLREILGGYVGAPPELLRFRYGPSGKPSLEEPSAVRFSLSHAEDLAVVALHRTLEVGVDVERLRPIANGERIAARFFSTDEHRALLGVPVGLRDRAFVTCWTRKEACAKALGGDLLPLLERIEVPVDPAAPPRLARIDGVADAAGRWSLIDLAPASGYIGALAVPGPLARVLAWQCPRVAMPPVGPAPDPR